MSGWNETAGLHVRAQEIPLLQDLSFVATASSLHLDEHLRLDAIGNCSGLACLSRGSTRFGSDTGHDAYASWGRWTDGEAHVRSFGVTWMRLPLSENQGIHYLIGTPTVSMPTSGTFSYGIIGATQPTISDGSTGPGTFVAAAVVQFASGTDTKIGLQGTVAMPTGTMTFATTGGTTNPQSSNLQMTSPNTFSGQLATQAGGASPLSCGSSGCRTTVTGGFFGPQAARLGFGYSISGDTRQRTIGGVGVLTR